MSSLTIVPDQELSNERVADEETDDEFEWYGSLFTPITIPIDDEDGRDERKS